MLQNKIINWLQVVSMYYCIYVYIGGDVCVTHIGIILYANPNTHCEPSGIPNVHRHIVISFGS